MGQVNAYSTVVIKTCKVHGKRWRCCLLFMVIFSNRSIWFFIVGLFFGHRSLVLSYNTVVISWRPFFWSERWSFLHRSRVVMYRLLLSSATYYQCLLPYTYLLPSTLRLLPYILPTYYHLPSYGTPTTIYQLTTNSTICLQQIFLWFILAPAKPVWRRFYIKLFSTTILQMSLLSKQEIWPDIYCVIMKRHPCTRKLKLYNYYLS